jgi:mono/diheme cytochrome c family protein
VVAFEALFGSSCAGCHGADGQLGPAPPLNDPLFRALVPESELRKVLNQGRPGTSMSAFLHENGGALTAVQIQVIIDGIKGVTRYQVEAPSADGQAKSKFVPIAPPWGTVEPAPASAPPYALPGGAGNTERGAKLFARACAMCHGENGLGVERDGRRLNRINDRAFLALISDQALRRIIITGRPDLKMPSYAQKAGRPDDFQPLTSDQIADLGALLASWRAGPAVAGR